MDIILYNILAGIICLIIGYFFGSIPFAIIIGKVFLKKDPRDYGSKNAGGTNCMRVFGKKWGILVICLDALKTVIPVWMCFLIMTYANFGGQTLLPDVKTWLETGVDAYTIKYPAYWLAAAGVTLGHCYPIFANFKGGKGASHIWGLLLTTSWMHLLIPMGTFFIVMKKTKYMSLSVLISHAIATFTQWVVTILLLTHVLPSYFVWLQGYGPTLYLCLTSSIVYTFCFLMMVIRHIPNIKRLRDGTERKMGEKVDTAKN